MLSLNFFARHKFCVALETKSLLRIIRCACSATFKFNEINNQNAKNRCYRQYSTPQVKNEVTKTQASGGEVSTSTIETVKETTKTITYTGILMLGLGITGVIFYAIFSELFSGNSANNVYSKALDRCLKNEKVVMSLGEPIKAFGEESSRGRRHHTSHLHYKKDGINYLRMKFYIRGSRKKATVHLEMKENESRNFDYRYLFVQLDEYPYTTIVLEDNRGERASILQPKITISGGDWHSSRINFGVGIVISFFLTLLWKVAVCQPDREFSSCLQVKTKSYEADINCLSEKLFLKSLCF